MDLMGCILVGICLEPFPSTEETNLNGTLWFLSLEGTFVLDSGGFLSSDERTKLFQDEQMRAVDRRVSTRKMTILALIQVISCFVYLVKLLSSGSLS